MQFPEHKNGNRINHPKIHKLDKLARLLNVTIHIDGVAYGSEESVVHVTANAEQIAKDYFVEDTDEIVVTVSEKVNISDATPTAPKKRGRPKKSD